MNHEKGLCLCLIPVLQVCRNAETCESKGCAYVTMGSINSARKAIVALDRLVSECETGSLSFFDQCVLAI